MNPRLLVIPVFLLWSLLVNAQAPPAGSNEHQRLLLEGAQADDQEIRDLRAQIFKTLPPQEALIVNSISFRLIGGPRLGDQLILPSAQIEEGARTVTIGQGFIRQLSLFIQEEVYAKQYDKQAEVDQHISLVLRQLKENQVRVANGSPLAIVQSGDAYFHWSEAVERNVFDTSDKILAINLAFILAHEAGHHVLGHTELNRASITREQRLNMEEAADTWATRTLISSGQLPVSATMSLMMFDRMYKAGLDDDHPSNDCRMRALIVSSIESLDEFRSRIEATGNNVEVVRRNWKRSLAALDEGGFCSGQQTAHSQTGEGQSDLGIIISKAASRELASLRGARDPDIDDAWAPTIRPEFPLDCFVSYDRSDKAYSYDCSHRYDDESGGDEALRNLESALSAVPGVKQAESESGNRHVYRKGGVRIMVGMQPPRSTARHPKWTVQCFIFEPDT